MRRRLQTVVETPEFAGRVSRLLTAAQRIELVDHVAANPDAGDLIPGSGGARKLRWGAIGRGKRGGVRVITYFGGPLVPVFLLSVFGKNEKANLSQAERNELRRILAQLAAEYRKGVRRHVESRRKHP